MASCAGGEEQKLKLPANFPGNKNAEFFQKECPEYAKSKPQAGMDAGCNGFVSFFRSKKLTAQKRHGGRF
jgi:hypothetical protein